MEDSRRGDERGLLDPRTFPVERIAALVHALPSPGVEVDVADVEGGAEAVAWLNAHGRPARLVPAAEPRPTRLWEPSPGLRSFLGTPHPLPPLPQRGEGKRALDLGCGTGRDAVFLAMRGWDVTAVDRLPDALERARLLAELHGVSLRLAVCDVAREPLPAGPFDLVTAFRFLPSFTLMASLLGPGGAMVVETFTDRERARTGKPRDPAMVLPAADPPPLPEGVELGSYEVGEHGGRELATLWAARRCMQNVSPA